MEYRKLPHGEEQISVIGLGNSSLTSQVGEKEIQATVEMALESGVNYFDMAAGDAAPFAAYQQVLRPLQGRGYTGTGPLQQSGKDRRRLCLLRALRFPLSLPRGPKPADGGNPGVFWKVKQRFLTGTAASGCPFSMPFYRGRGYEKTLAAGDSCGAQKALQYFFSEGLTIPCGGIILKAERYPGWVF